MPEEAPIPRLIAPHAPVESFPPVETALEDPNGLLAVGGDLSPQRLIHAYRHGIFPWFGEEQPILWWSPDPRMVIFPEKFHCSRSLRRTLRRGVYRVTRNEDFGAVIRGCAAARGLETETWITVEMIAAYEQLHKLGYAHSFECWEGDVLAGGLYGVILGRVLFGESMFSHRPDASKVVLAHLCKSDFQLIDCQVANPHLQRLGAEQISRRHFVALLRQWMSPTDESAGRDHRVI